VIVFANRIIDDFSEALIISNPHYLLWVESFAMFKVTHEFANFEIQVFLPVFCGVITTCFYHVDDDGNDQRKKRIKRYYLSGVEDYLCFIKKIN